MHAVSRHYAVLTCHACSRPQSVKVFMYLFLQVVKGTHLLFLYAEYVGDDFDGDMDRLSLEPRDIEWHKICDPCQVR